MNGELFTLCSHNMNADNLVYIFSRMPSDPMVVICAVCSIKGNLGLMLHKMRKVVVAAKI